MTPPTATVEATDRAIVAPAEMRLPAGVSDIFVALEPSVPEASLYHEFARLLTETGKSKFLHDLLAALEDAVAQNDLRPVQRVILCYYRTSLFVGDEGFVESLLATEREKPIGRAERRKLLGIERRS